MSYTFARRVLLGVTLIGISSSVYAENYLEFAHAWLVNPRWPNWTCALWTGNPALQGGCTPPSTSAGYAFVEAHIVRRPTYSLPNGQVVNQDTAHVYVQSFGPGQGPGSECQGDSILHFRAPWTHDGLRGVGVTYVGVTHPSVPSECAVPGGPVGSLWGIGGAFWDTYLNKMVILANKAATDTSLKDLKYGLAAKDHVFTWHNLVKSGVSNVNFRGSSLRPHPSISGLWFGVLAYTDDPGGFAEKTAWIEVDHVLNKVRIMTSSGWRETTIGGTFNFTPAAFWTGVAASQLVDLGGGRYEVWGAPLVSRSGQVPCAGGTPNSFYLANTSATGSPADQARGSFGRGGSYKVVTVVNQTYTAGNTFTLSANYDLSKAPTDYFTGLMNPTRFEVAGATTAAVYSGSADATICAIDFVGGNYAFGTGIKFRAVSLQ